VVRASQSGIPFPARGGLHCGGLSERGRRNGMPSKQSEAVRRRREAARLAMADWVRPRLGP